jgi:hypothetical protein
VVVTEVGSDVGKAVTSVVVWPGKVVTVTIGKVVACPDGTEVTGTMTEEPPV